MVAIEVRAVLRNVSRCEECRERGTPRTCGCPGHIVDQHLYIMDLEIIGSWGNAPSPRSWPSGRIVERPFFVRDVSRKR